MSVTFAPTFNIADIQGYEVECWNNPEVSGPVVVGVSADREGAVAQSKAHKAVCTDCAVYGTLIEEVSDAPEVNVSNVNARRILGMLGLDTDDLCGSADAALFAERVAFAAVVHGGDQGTDTIVYREMRGATMVDCGREAGYTDMRLEQLRAVAVWAAEHGRRVTWA